MKRRLLNLLTVLSLLLCVAAVGLSCSGPRQPHPSPDATAPLTASEAEEIALAKIGSLPPDWKIKSSDRARGRWWVRFQGNLQVRGEHAVVEVFDDGTARVNPGK